jgi:ABC-2 type transport system permease protein
LASDAATYRSSIPRPFWLSELWDRRELIALLVARDIKVRYKRSILGFVWTLLSPIFTIMIFSLVFSRLFQRYYQDYKLYMISGVLLWSFFSAATSQGLNSLIAGGPIIRKIAVPKIVFPTTVVASNFVNLLLSLIPLAGFMLIAHAKITIHLLWLPMAMPLLFMFTLGVVLVLSTVTVFLRDIRNIWEAVIMIWFFLTPVFYPRGVVPEKWDNVLRFNPMLSIIEVCRLPIYLGIAPPFDLYLKSAIASVVTLIAAAWLFRRYEDRFVLYL